MPSYNRVVLVGNLTRDPGLRYLPNQTPVVNFGIAVNRTYTKDGEKKEEVAFVDLEAWGKSAETINQYLKKGSCALFEGRLKYESWEDKSGGGKRSKLIVVVEGFQFLDGRKRDEPSEPAAGPSRGSFRRPETQEQEPPYGENDRHFAESDVPF